MILTIIAGATGTGKTQLTREKIKPYPNVCVYDRQGHDYPEFPVFDHMRKTRKFRMVGRKSIEQIKLMADPENGVKGFCFVVEEATGIFDSSVGREWVDIALSKRHRNNRFFFIFHALHRVPPDLMEYADYVYLFKTGDFHKNIKSKFPDIYPDFLKLNTGEKIETKTENFRGKTVNVREFVELRKQSSGGIISEHIFYRRTDLSKQNYL